MAAARGGSAALWRGNALVILALMWADGLRVVILAVLPDALGGIAHGLIVIARELAWWWVIALLGAVVLDFLGRTGMGRGLAPRPAG
jgi:hypothetical protein